MRSLVAAGLILQFSLVGAEARESSDVRSLQKDWTWRGGAQEISNDGHAIFVRARGHALAIDATGGNVLWDTTTEDDPIRLGDRLKVLDDVVAVAAGANIFLLDKSNGAVRARLQFRGPVRFLASPPLVALVNWRLVGPTLFRIDTNQGRVAARRRLGWLAEVSSDAVNSFAVMGPVVIVRGYRSLTGFRLPDLKEIWRTAAESPMFEFIDGSLFVQVIENYDRGAEFFRIDPTSGRLQQPLPKRFSINSDYGVSTWEVEILDSPRWKSERLRRNNLRIGKPIWVTKVLEPGPIYWARRNEILYVQCQDGKSVGRLIAIDWDTGRSLWTAESGPNALGLFLLGDQILTWAFDDRLIARRLPPAAHH